jgi:hypothetical protein
MIIAASMQITISLAPMRVTKVRPVTNTPPEAPPELGIRLKV